MSKRFGSATEEVAREQIRRGQRRLGPKPEGKAPLPFAAGLDLSRVINVSCSLCDAKAVVPRPDRRDGEQTPDYLMRCKDAAVHAHTVHRPNCPGDLQVSMTL